MHLNQVHKETLDQVENALPNRKGLDVEIFGMEGMPQDVLDQRRTRIIQNFYQAQEDRRIATGNPLPGQALKDSRKKIRIETAEELKARFAEWRARRKDGGEMEGVVPSEAPTQVRGIAFLTIVILLTRHRTLGSNSQDTLHSHSPLLSSLTATPPIPSQHDHSARSPAHRICHNDLRKATTGTVERVRERAPGRATTSTR